MYKIIDIINVILLAKIFDDWTLGQYNQYIMESSFLILFLNLGLGISVQYFVGKGVLDPKRVSRLSTYIMLGAVLVLGLLSPVLQAWLGFNYTTQFFLIWIIAYAIFGIWQELNYNLCLSIKKINTVNISILLGPLIVILVLILKWGGLLELSFRDIILLAVANQFFIGLVSTVTLQRATLPKIVKQKVGIRDILSFGFLVYVTNLMQFLVYRFDYWVLERHDIDMFPYFTLAAQMLSFLWFVPQRVSDISYIHTIEKEEKVDRIILVSAGLMFYAQLVIGILFSLIFITVFWVLDISNYFVSIEYFLILLLPASMMGVSMVFSAYQAGKRRLMIDFWSTALAFILAIVLSLWLIPKYGVRGALIECSITYIVSFVYQYYFFQKYCKFSPKMLLSEPVKELRRLLNEKDFSFNKLISDR